MNKKIIFFIILIVAIICLFFLSQQPYSKNILKDILSFIEKNSTASLLGGINFNKKNNESNAENVANTEINQNNSNINNAYNNDKSSKKLIGTIPFLSDIGANIINIAEKVDTGVKSGGEAIANGFDQAKENITQEIPKKIENYFTGIKNAVAGKTETNNCSCPATK